MPLSARLASFYFAYFAYTAAWVAYFPLYLAGRGLDAGALAVVLALPQIARIFAPAGWGWIADRTGAQRGIVVLSCAAMAAGMALLPAVPGALGIGALVAAVSLLSAGALPLVEAITLGSLASGAARYGPIRLWGSVGFIAVVLAGGAWLDVGSVRVLPPALAAFSLLALAAAAGFPRARAPGPAGAGGFRVTRAAGSLIAAGFLMAAAHGALYAFLTLHLKRLGYSGSAIGVFWTLGVLAEIAVFACLPQLFRRFSLPQILLASLACAVVRFSIIGWAASELWLLVIAQLLHAATFGAFHAASVAAVQRIFPAGAHARGQALYSSLSNGAGGAAGVLAAGWGWQMGGAGTTFSLAALAAALGAYFAYRLKRSGF